MKKTIAIFSLLGITALASACSDDVKRYCDVGVYTEKCDGGVYLRCVDGEVTEEKVVHRGGLDYACSDDGVLTPIGIKCFAGRVVNAESGALLDKLCTDDGLIIFCSGDKVKVQTSYCRDNGVYFCKRHDANMLYEISVRDCGNDVCEEYERGMAVGAGCFDMESVTEGCGEMTSFGVCGKDDNKLTFCSSSDPAKGKTLSMNCGSFNSGICEHVDARWGYDCTETCGRSELGLHTYRGRCTDDGVLLYCTEDGKATKWDCRSEGFDCGISWADPLNPVYDCIPKTSSGDK